MPGIDFYQSVGLSFAVCHLLFVIQKSLSSQNQNHSLLQLLDQLEAWRDRLLTRLNLHPKEEDIFISEVEAQREFPEAYARRFVLSPLQDPGQVKGREEELNGIQRARNNWERGGSALLLIGEPGAGMTSLLNAAFPQLPPSQRLADDQRIRSEEQLRQLLAAALGCLEHAPWDKLEQAEAGDHPVIVFENVERLFLRQVGGYALLERFFLLLNATRRRFFWVVTISSYSYYYLNSILRISANFRSAIRLQPLPDETIREILLERNQGYELVFLKPEVMGPRALRALSRQEEEKRQETLGGQLLDAVAGAAKGNVSRALLIWLRSVQRVGDERIYLRQREMPKADTPDLPELFVLEAIFQHTSLSADDLELILRTEEVKGGLVLDQLLDRGWLHARTSRQDPPEYQVNLLYLEELKGVLRDRLNRKMK